MIDKISTAAVVVSDAKKAVAWYTKKLGFELRESKGHWITVAPKASKMSIHLCQGKEFGYELEPGNTGMSFMTKDIDKTYKELSAKGVEFTKEPADEGFGKYAMFKDLDNNEFWLFQS